jgi:RimJ/RimL family protein N-acetyltransferase
MKRFIYKVTDPVAERQDFGDARFVLCMSAADILRIVAPVIKREGLAAAVRLLLRQAKANRGYYAVLVDNTLASYGHVSLGFCRFYEVGNKDVVIGPIATDETFRGRRYATRGLKQAIAEMKEFGYKTFWIDTTEDNPAMMKVIERVGFGEAFVERDEGEGKGT